MLAERPSLLVDARKKHSLKPAVVVVAVPPVAADTPATAKGLWVVVVVGGL
jgi:hypothetical protein